MLLNVLHLKAKYMHEKRMCLYAKSINMAFRLRVEESLLNPFT